MSEHKSWCNYPRDPCDCKKEREREKTQHASWCTYPRDPCDCEVGKA